MPAPTPPVDPYVIPMSAPPAVSGQAMLGVTDEAIIAADMAEETDEQKKAYAEEEASVTKWLNRIQEARDFDKQVWTQMAIDRDYAAGYSTFEVSVNLIGSAIDVMKSFLVAKQPEVAVTAAPQVPLPPLTRPIQPAPPPALLAAQSDPAAAMEFARENPAALPAAQQMVAAFQRQQAVYQQEMSRYTAEVTARRDARDAKRRFNRTLEIIISDAWRKGGLQPQAETSTGAGLTTGIGWFKGTWHEDRGLDPVTARRVNTIQDNLALLDERRATLADGDAGNIDAARQELNEILLGLRSQTEVVINRGMTIDAISSDDLTFPIGVTDVTKPCDSPWIDHRLFMTMADAKRMFGKTVKLEKLKSATSYSQRKPQAPAGGVTPMFNAEADLNPSQFTSGEATAVTKTEFERDGQGTFVCVHETWDRDAGVVRTMIEGVKCYVRPPKAPDIATTRFYPFFCTAFTKADGQRYPQSLVWRSFKLQDEYNRTRSAWAEARRRSKLGIMFDETAIDPDGVTKLTTSATGEWTGIKVGMGKRIDQVFWPRPYVKIDPAVYDTVPIRRDFEDIWGIQQALQGSVKVEQTATEAEIQQQGFGARTGAMRDAQDKTFSEFGQYTAEIVLQRLTPVDAKAIAGPGAEWVVGFKASDLASLCRVDIKAGSSGKPNTAAQRAAWSVALPQLQAAIVQIGQLRGAPPTVIADKLEKLVAHTFEVSGLDMDIEDAVPQEMDGSGGMQTTPEGQPIPIAGPMPQPGVAEPAIPAPPGLM
jgi:hypothetical protein